MSNIGSSSAAGGRGHPPRHTRVGDRYVLEAMERDGCVLGGEQSGHVIFRRYATTGDGLLTAVRFLSLAAATGVSVGELAGGDAAVPAGAPERPRVRQGGGGGFG